MRRVYWSCLIILIGGGIGCIPQGYQGPIGTTVTDPDAIRIIIPTHEQTNDAHHAIATLARQRAKTLGLDEDVIMTDDQALSSDLKNYHLHIYGTAEGNHWFKQYVQQLPFTLTKERLITGQTHTGANLCIVIGWHHPQNPTRSVVIQTAFMSDDVAGYTGPLPQNHDYLVARGETIIEKGRFTKKHGTLIFPAWTLTGKQAKEDIAQLFKTIESVHPKLKLSKDAGSYNYYQKISQVMASRLVNQDGIVSKAAFVQHIAKVCANVGDGHTTWTYDETIANTSDPTLCMLPFEIAYRTDSFFIGPAIPALEHLKGLKILSINNDTILKVIQPVTVAISGVRDASRIASLLKHQRTYWSLYHPTGENLAEIVTEDTMGQQQAFVVDLMSLADYDQVFNTMHTIPTPKSRYYHNNHTCYWRLASDLTDPIQTQQIQTQFEALHNNNIQNLILDLRQYEGSPLENAIELTRYLIPSPFRFYGQINTKISPEALVQGRYLEHKKQKGHVYEHITEAHSPVEANHFQGKLFVLIGPGTRDEGVGIASTLKAYNIGTLIGEMTGGTRESFGGGLIFTLPHSRIQYRVATQHYFPSLPGVKDNQMGTTPMITATESLLRAFQQEPDPLLAFVLDAIEKRQAHDENP